MAMSFDPTFAALCFDLTILTEDESSLPSFFSSAMKHLKLVETEIPCYPSSVQDFLCSGPVRLQRLAADLAEAADPGSKFANSEEVRGLLVGACWGL